MAVIGRSLHRELAEEGDGLFPQQKHAVGTAEAEWCSVEVDDLSHVVRVTVTSRLTVPPCHSAEVAGLRVSI